MIKTTFILWVLLPAHFIIEAQSTLEIQNLKIDDNREIVEVNSTITATLELDQPQQVVLFEKEDQKLTGEFEFARSGNRIKLIVNLWLNHKNQALKAKQEKYVQFIKESIPGNLQGFYSNQFLIDKAKLEYLSVKFNFNFNY
ncbi:MAG: hypothetical protein RJQ09_19120 [Cyclobacteriaceae bacterium]